MIIKIATMRSDKGLYIANNTKNYNNVRNPLLTNLRINGITEFSDTHHESWKLLEGYFEISSVETRRSGYNMVNIRWELNKGVDIPGLPKVISQEDADEFQCEDYNDWNIGKACSFYQYRTLYIRDNDLEPLPYEAVEFEVVDLGTATAKDLDSFSEARIAVYNNSNRDYGTHLLSSVVEYSELAELLVPDIMIHNQPCTLSQDNTYHVIRKYVKDNIDRRYATISSDYDFCFAVTKKVQIKPVIIRTEEKKSNGKSYAKPRFKTREVTDKKFIIFSMCPAKKYGNYTPIQGWKGDNLKELHDNMKQFLDELMETINKPLHECDCCEGTGYLLPTSVDANKR